MGVCDTPSTPESVMRIPDIKLKEGYLHIEVSQEDEIIKFRLELLLHYLCC